MTPAQITHPESAWIADAAPLALAVAAVLLLSLLLRGRLRAALLDLLQRRAARSLAAPIEPALIWTPPIGSEARLLTGCLLVPMIMHGLFNATSLTVMVFFPQIQP